jgi:predicted phosphodiesterase
MICKFLDQDGFFPKRMIWLIPAMLIIILSLSGCVWSKETPLSEEQHSTTTQTDLPVVEIEQTKQNPSFQNTEIPGLTPSVTTAAATATPPHDYFSIDYPLSTVAYVIPLSIRYVDEQEAVLFFELSEARAGKLVYRSSDNGELLQFEIPFEADKLRHLIVLEGLPSNRTYLSDVFIYGEEESLEKPVFAGSDWGAISFSTTFDEEPLRVGVLGDASFGDQASTSLVEHMVSYDLDFVILTGDVVYVYPEDTDPYLAYAEKYFLPFSPLLHKLPVYTVLGNHDYDPGIALNGQPYYDYAFPGFTPESQGDADPPGRNQYYSLAYQDVQFLFLDSQTIFGVAGRKEQETWLNERLADSQYRFSIPILHVSPFSSSVVHPDDQLPIRYTWAPKFSAAKVPVVFSGHFHHYERLVSEGVTYIVSGGGSSILYAVGELLPESQIYLSQTHFVLMEIYAERIELQAITPQGEMLDQAVITIK